MEATLKFTLPEESEEFETACKSSDWKALADDILNRLRNDYKYNESLPESDKDYAYKLREWIIEQMGEAGLRMNP